MKIELVNYTNNPLKVIYAAARTCYSSQTPIEIWNAEAGKNKILKLVKKVFEAGHHSVFEHVNFTFAIEGISRACSHQLVRHRLMSPSQQSQRYVKNNEHSYVIPHTILKNKEAVDLYEEAIQNIYNTYNTLIEKYGIPKEDARFLLPNAAKTNLIITMNFRELFNISQVRLCGKAQWEIRELFWKIKGLLMNNDELYELGKLLQPKCMILGYCPEKDSCGYIDFYKNNH